MFDRFQCFEDFKNVMDLFLIQTAQIRGNIPLQKLAVTAVKGYGLPKLAFGGTLIQKPCSVSRILKSIIIKGKPHDDISTRFGNAPLFYIPNKIFRVGWDFRIVENF